MECLILILSECFMSAHPRIVPIVIDLSVGVARCTIEEEEVWLFLFFW